LDKARDFQKEYKHNINIWKKNMIKSEQKFKTFIFKMKEENVEFKEKTWQMKSHAEKLKELRKMAKD
jgi:ribosome maturation factor RimP